MRFSRKEAHRAGLLLGLLVTVIGVTAVGCSSPTSPDPVVPVELFQLTNATVSVDGAMANGESFQMGQMTGSSTFFQATLMGPNGAVAGETVQARYTIPHQGPGMMGGGPGEGVMMLYDDGTHGDPVAGDGTYCYEDFEGQYGFHMHGAPAGQYHYEFYGVHHDQQHTNHMAVDVTMTAAAVAASLRVTNAQIMVDGNLANGQTVHMGQATGSSTFFQATLMEGDGPALGHVVQAQYEIPHGGPGMMHGGGGQGYMTLYDDGTHGDPIAGDGIYCYEDFQGQYGFHMQGAPAGEYHYHFFGIDHDQQHTDHMSVFVTMVSN